MNEHITQKRTGGKAYKKEERLSNILFFKQEEENAQE
jgi:hypothetical protein